MISNGHRAGKLRILIWAVDFKPLTGGVAEYTHQLAHHLQVCGDDVVVYAPQMLNASGFDASTSYKVVRYARQASNRKIGRAVHGYRKLLELCKQNQIDVIVCSHINGVSVMAMWLVSRHLRIPYVVCLYGTELARSAGHVRTFAQLRRTLRAKWLITRASLLLMGSNHTLSLLARLTSAQRSSTVVYPGIADEYVAAVGLSDDPAPSLVPCWKHRKVMLTLSRLIPRKGIDQAIRAVDIIRRQVPDVAYLIAGDGRDLERLRHITRELGLESHVYFVGPVDEDLKSYYYGLADVFVLPNRELEDGDIEGFGIVFLEANAHGKPVIGGNSGGAVEAIQHGTSGILIDPLDHRQLAAAVIELFTDKQYAAWLGAEGRKRVEREFLWSKLAVKARDALFETVRRCD